MATDKKMATPVKESANTKSSKLFSSVAEDIKALDKKWSERFSKLEAMLIARTFQPTTSQPSFNRFQCHLRDCHWLVYLPQIDHSFLMPDRSVRP